MGCREGKEDKKIGGGGPDGLSLGRLVRKETLGVECALLIHIEGVRFYSRLLVSFPNQLA